MYAVETKNLGKHFKNGRAVLKAVDDVSLQINKGEIFCLLGQNGAGKTTLFKMLAALILPTQGSICINGFDAVSQDIKVKSSLGFINGDERSFYWRLNGRQNLEFFAALYDVSSSAAAERIAYLMDLLKIKNTDKKVGEYSAGMKQRLNIARGLLHDPDILLMDEPTRSLDPDTAIEIRNFLKTELNGRQGRTILFSTHNMEESYFLADRTGIMKAGKVVPAAGRDTS